MNKKVKLLHLEDSDKDSELIRSIIDSGEIWYEYFLADNEKDFKQILEHENIDLILSDYGLPDYNGEKALKVAMEQYSNIPFIFVSGTIGEDDAITAMVNGATDFVLKNKLERLVPAIKRALDECQTELERKQAELELIIANKELLFQGEEKEKRAAELIVANKELVFQNREKEKRAEELLIANKELAFQNGEKEQRAKELIVANKELAFQNGEKEQRAKELIVANKELAFQNGEKEKRAAELIIANLELHFQNEEKEKRAAELVKAREKAEESDNLKTAFLNNLSHEIRTPMNQILGFSSFLKDPDLSEVQHDEYIGIINSQSHQLLHIIDEIVEISEITTGQVDLMLKAFNFEELMDELLAFYKPKAEHRNLKLCITKGITGAEVFIRGDQIKLKQIFSHLIENAIKFTDNGQINIEYSRAGNLLIVAIKDTGIGIDEEEKKVIFDRFRQVEITMTRKYGGLGLGLSISNAYIRMMSGIIKLESEPGMGSTFIVELPYLPAAQFTGRIADVFNPLVISRPDWKDKTILIAEDEESNIQYIRAVLKSTGVNILVAVNGLEAVEQCKSHPDISLVLMDIKMPRMDGMEATRIIKSIHNDLPIIAVTAFAMSKEREYILQSGCSDYLPKPIKRDDLIAIIQKHIDTLQLYEPAEMIEFKRSG